jgi:hypothetical protein
MAYLPTADLATSFPPCVAGLTPAECGDADSHYARVICALCYLAMGGLDEAHNMARHHNHRPLLSPQQMKNIYESILVDATLTLPTHGVVQVTPLSWESRTPFSGPPVINSPAVQEASYVHTLIHRLDAHPRTLPCQELDNLPTTNRC